MADYAEILRVAKILAKATSPEAGEAAAAPEQAYKRMIHDQVSFQDLLTLPEEKLYQQTLVRLVDVILSHQTQLSPSSKREAYAEYMRLIVRKFSGAESHSSRSSGSNGKTREEEARDYRERNGYEYAKQQERDFANKNTNAHKHENTETQKHKNVFVNLFSNVPSSISWLWDSVRPLFERGGFIWLVVHQPLIMFRLFLASVLWGMALALILIIVAGVIHALTHTAPVVDFQLKNVFSALTALGTIWRYRLFLKQT